MSEREPHPWVSRLSAPAPWPWPASDSSPVITGCCAHNRPASISRNLNRQAVRPTFLEDRIARRQKASEAKARSEWIEALLSADAEAVVQRAAEKSGRSVSDFVVGSAPEAVEKTNRELEVIVLSARDSITFAEALLNPKGPNEALLAAARRHRELFGGL